MPDRYAVRGGVAGAIPGVIGPDELDGRLEWIPLRPPRDLPEAISTRLGSDDDVRRVLLAVLAPLRGVLEGAPLGALLATLPAALARELAEAELNLGSRIAPGASAPEYLAEAARLLLYPPAITATYVRAVFGAAKKVLAPEAVEAIAARLPEDVGALWRTAR